MLIGGSREKDKLWLLLQNWWDDMQLVEVDSAYFAESNASLYFGYDLTDANLDKFYTMNSSFVADSNNLDRADYYGNYDCFTEPRFGRLGF